MTNAGAAERTLFSRPDLDTVRSPYTGFVRETWIRIGTRLLEKLLQHSSGLSAPLKLPERAGAPDSRRGARGQREINQYQYAETFARSSLLATAMLIVDPELQVSGRSVADYYRDYLVRGCSASATATFGWDPPERPSQLLVEAAFICIVLWEGRSILWDPLEYRDKLAILSWLDHYKDQGPFKNNWCWFSILINTYLKMHDRPWNDAVVEKCLDRVRSFYLGAGWYKDGNNIDFYSAWVMQFHAMYWVLWDGASYPERRDALLAHNRAFLDGFSHVFSRSGMMPIWGRSICYRFAATSPYALAFKQDSPPDFDPGFARYLSSANLRQFVAHPDFLVSGVPSLGFYGPDDALVDDYSCVASPMWCYQAFLSLTLPASNPYWTAVENLGHWKSPEPRHPIGSTGIEIQHDCEGGHSTLHVPVDLVSPQRRRDPRYGDRAGKTADVDYALPAWCTSSPPTPNGSE